MRTESIVRGRWLRVSLAAVLAISSAIVVASPAQATVAPLCFAQQGIDLQVRNEALNIETSMMRAASQSDDEINSYLAKHYGLVQVSEAASVAPDSSASHLDVRTPTIYRDTCSSWYTAVATWGWNSTQALENDRGFFCAEYCALGGDDGFGIAFNRSVASAGGYSMSTWGRTSVFPVSTSRAHVEDANTSGATFAGIDHSRGSAHESLRDYSWYNGQLVYSISSPGCGTLQAFSKYGHTWSSTSVSGFSVAPWSLSISFSSSSSRFQETSQPSNTVIPC